MKIGCVVKVSEVHNTEFVVLLTGALHSIQYSFYHSFFGKKNFFMNLFKKLWNSSVIYLFFLSLLILGTVRACKEVGRGSFVGVTSLATFGWSGTRHRFCTSCRYGRRPTTLIITQHWCSDAVHAKWVSSMDNWHLYLYRGNWTNVWLTERTAVA